MEGERLQKVLARAGFGSRRAAEQLIAEGRVTVGGDVAALGRRVDPERDRIAVDGIPVVTRADLVYYLLNKPPRVVTTARDPQHRPTVVELVPLEPRVFPVGRLDYETEGLLVMTNDGDLAQRLTHPRHGFPKTYLAEVEGHPSRGALRRLREGVVLDDGPTAPARVRIRGEQATGSVVEVSITEGRNRQVRRMMEAVGHPVTRLVRTRIGPVADAALGPGRWRPLTVREVRELYRAAGG
ncbi:MAG: rRNA pseudouridine synthase [Acidimicrobiia bacterium]|nr:rRNA pseudouridine synthase [Acidimicrobiia bacterium]